MSVCVSASRVPSPPLTAALNAALSAGVLVAALVWLICALPAAAQQTAPDLAQAGPADDSLQLEPGLDPWNVKIDQLPTWDPRNAPPRLQPRAKRHLEFIQAGVPVEYRSQRNPFPNAPEFIAQGGDLYRANCVACHGPKGRGDGDAGLDLVPSPALLNRMMDAQGRVDEYLLWSVSEGGKPFDTAMPAFKDRLTEDQIWKIIVYMRAGFPQPDQ